MLQGLSHPWLGALIFAPKMTAQSVVRRNIRGFSCCIILLCCADDMLSDSDSDADEFALGDEGEELTDVDGDDDEEDEDESDVELAASPFRILRNAEVRGYVQRSCAWVYLQTKSNRLPCCNSYFMLSVSLQTFDQH